MALYQTQPDRKLRAKALAKEYGIGGHSHDFLDGSRGFVNHDWKGLEFDHYPDHQKITLKWAQVEKYIDLMIQSDRYLTDEEKEQCTTVQEENGYKVGDDVMVDLPTGTIEGTIHNYFFAKAIDQVRPGGIVAFVTSRYTMAEKSVWMSA